MRDNHVVSGAKQSQALHYQIRVDGGHTTLLHEVRKALFYFCRCTGWGWDPKATDTHISLHGLWPLVPDVVVMESKLIDIAQSILHGMLHPGRVKNYHLVCWHSGRSCARINFTPACSLLLPSAFTVTGTARSVLTNRSSWRIYQK